MSETSSAESSPMKKKRCRVKWGKTIMSMPSLCKRIAILAAAAIDHSTCKWPMKKQNSIRIGNMDPPPHVIKIL